MPHRPTGRNSRYLHAGRPAAPSGGRCLGSRLGSFGRFGWRGLGLTVFEILGTACLALFEPGVTGLYSVAPGQALRSQIGAANLAGIRFFGALVDAGCKHDHQTAGEREERHAYFTFHARTFQISPALVQQNG